MTGVGSGGLRRGAVGLPAPPRELRGPPHGRAPSPRPAGIPALAGHPPGGSEDPRSPARQPGGEVPDPRGCRDLRSCRQPLPATAAPDRLPARRPPAATDSRGTRRRPGCPRVPRPLSHGRRTHDGCWKRLDLLLGTEPMICPYSAASRCTISGIRASWPSEPSLRRSGSLSNPIRLSTYRTPKPATSLRLWATGRWSIILFASSGCA